MRLGKGLVSDSVLLSALLVVVTAGAVILVLASALSRKIEEAADLRLATGSKLFATKLQEDADDLRAVGDWLAKDPDFQQAVVSGDGDFLERQLALAMQLTAVDEVVVVTRGGQSLARQLTDDLADRPADSVRGPGFRAARSGRVSSGVEKAPGNFARQEVYLPVPDPRSGQPPAGVLRLSAHLEQVRLDRFKELTGLDLSIFLEGERLATTLRLNGVPMTDTGPDPTVYREVVQEGRSATIARDLPVGPVRSAYTALKGPDGTRVGMYSVSLPISAILGQWWDTVAQSAAVIALVVAMGALLAYLVTRRVREPVLALAGAAARLREGDLATPIPTTHEPELEPLARNLEEARASLRANLEQVVAGEARERAMFETLHEAVLVTNDQGRVLRSNPAGEELLGPGLEGRGILELLPFIARAAAGNQWQGSLQSRTGQQLEVEVTCAHLEGGQLPAVMVYVVHDVSRFAEMSRMREELLYNLAHELRSPLSILDNSLEILSADLQELTTKEVEQLLRSAQRTSTRLRTLMEDLLSAGNIEAGEFVMRRQRVPLRPIIDAAVEAIEPFLESKQQQVAVDLDGDLLVLADRRYVRQVLTNILSNASNYGPSGESIAIRAQQAGDEKVLIKVQDRGPGIPPARQARLFQRFYRGTASRRQPGVGLGLAIARSIIEAHGGSIGVESEPGEGTTVWFTLPPGQRVAS